MKSQIFIMMASLATTVAGAQALSASTAAEAEYGFTCLYNPPRGAVVSYSAPCDGYSAQLACDEAENVCGMSLRVTGVSGSTTCVADCREDN